MLHIAHIIENEASKFIEPGQFLGEAQIPFGGQQPLHQIRGRRPEHRMACQDELVAKRCRAVTFPHSWSPNGDYVRGALQKTPRGEPLKVKLKLGWQTLEIKIAKGL